MIDRPFGAWPAGYQLLSFDEIDSTSSEARRQADQGHPGPVWIMARRQSAGRGRRGRTWISEAGNLYATLLIRPALSVMDAGRVSFVTALAVREALAPLVPPTNRLMLKWPNDLLLDRRKIAGILLESRGGAGGMVEDLTIGIGINLAHAPEGGVETPAIALAQVGPRVEPEEMLPPLASALARRLDEFHRTGFAPVRSEWLNYAVGLGEPIRVRLADRQIDGIFSALDLDGALVLAQDGGDALRIEAGEVFFRPAHAQSG